MRGSDEGTSHIGWMSEALAEARRALEEQEVPVGAVAVSEARLVGRGRNRREALQDPFAHAEMLAMGEAAHERGSWRLEGVTVYVTLEPCAMCAGAMVLARVSMVVFGCRDPKAGAAGSVVNLLRESRFNHQVAIIEGVLAEESSQLLSAFFAGLRGRE